jgi:hypothetical protein
LYTLLAPDGTDGYCIGMLGLALLSHKIAHSYTSSKVTKQALTLRFNRATVLDSLPHEDSDDFRARSKQIKEALQSTGCRTYM